MRIGILGYPKTGKTLLFNTLTGLSHDTGKFSAEKRHHVGVATLADPRLDRLAAVMKSAKTTYLHMEIVDLAGAASGDEMRKAVEVAEFRTADALLHGVRAFEDPEIPHVENTLDPARDIAHLEADLLLADLATTEKRLEKLRELVKKTKNPLDERQLAALEKCRVALEAEKPLRTLSFDRQEEDVLRGFAFLSRKPILHVVNIGERDIPRVETLMEGWRGKLGAALGEGSALAWASCKVEAELAAMPPEEAAPFAEEWGFKEPCRPRVLRALGSLLRMLTFYTAGENESRAWWTALGSTAVEAAGRIHSDFAKGFIRAEVVACEDVFACGSFAEAKNRGVYRMEGRDYAVKDGDVMLFRFNVS